MIFNDKQWYVYIHTNKINNKKYIGITCQIPEERWGENGKHYSGQPKFYNAIQQYGWDNFSHEIIETNLDKAAALAYEAQLILEYNTVKEGYNSTSGLINDEELYSKEVYCLETGEVFPSVAAAARAIPTDACHFVNDEFNQEHYIADKFTQDKLDVKTSRDKLFAKLYADGKTQKEIAEITNSCKQTISAALKRQNIMINDRRIKVIALDKKTNQIIKEFNSMREACEWCGLGYNNVNRIRQAIIESWRVCKGYKWTTNDENLLKLRQKNEEKEI